MKKGIILIATLMIMSSIQAQEVITFNKIIEGQDVEIKKAKDSQQESTVFFELNDSLFEEDQLKVGVEIKIETPTGQEVLEITRVSEYIKGIRSIRAASERDESKIFSFTFYNGRLIGLYHESHNKNYQFKYNRDSNAYFMTDKKEEHLYCSNDDAGLVINEEIQKDLQSAKNKNVNEDDLVKGVFTSNNTNTVIDILIAYTNNSLAWARSNQDFDGIDGVLAQAMNLSQSALDNSGVPITVRLVYTHNVDYKEGFSQSSGDLLRLITASNTSSPFGITDPDGAMDELHDLRDEYGADLVALFASLNDGSGGVAWVTSNRLGLPELAFSVNRIEQIAYGYTVIHEMGHNMGLLHSRTQPTQKAPITGGVFQESVGYQNFEDNVSTVMAYPFAGSSDIPAFSNSAVSYEGMVTGFNGTTEIADAARSLKKMKGVISSYRLTKTDPPVASISTDKLEVLLNLNESLVVPVTISNNGLSGLDYDSDFEVLDGVILKQKNAVKNKILAESTIYSTSFETDFGQVGSGLRALSNWRSFSGNDITIVNSPSEGDQNLRLLSTGSGGEKNIAGQFIGILRYGGYKARFDVKLSEVENANNDQFDIGFYDGKTRELNAGIRVNNGVFSVLIQSEEGNPFYSATDKEISIGQYYSVEIDFNPETEMIMYYVDNELIHSAPFFKSGNTPSEIILSSTNRVSGAYIDFDNYSVSRYLNPTSWLTVKSSSGLINPDKSKNITLTFNSTDVQPGTYSLLLTVQTNDAANPKFEIPVSLTISGTVSNESVSDIASAFTLDQNYPNPFNPSTNISYSISNATNVLLEVFSINGKKVATLENNRKPVGSYTIRFEGGNLSSGVYIYQLKTESGVLTRQMVLIK